MSSNNTPSQNPFPMIGRVLRGYGSKLLSGIIQAVRKFTKFSATQQLFGGLGVVALLAFIAFINNDILNNAGSASQSGDSAPFATNITENINTISETPDITLNDRTEESGVIDIPSNNNDDNLQLLITRDYFVIYVMSQTSFEGLQLRIIDNTEERPLRSVLDDVPRLSLMGNIAPQGFCVIYTSVQNPNVGAPSQCRDEIQRIPLSANEMFWWTARFERQLQVAVYANNEPIGTVCDIDNFGGACSFSY